MKTSLVKKCAAVFRVEYKEVVRIRKRGCHVSLHKIPNPHLIIDFDKADSRVDQNEIRCDYMFIADSQDHDGWVVPIELKKGALHATKVHRQLSAGAVVAEKMVPHCANIKFRPTAAFGSIHIAERNKLKQRNFTVKYRGAYEPIRLLKCGASLSGALSV